MDPMGLCQVMKRKFSTHLTIHAAFFPFLVVLMDLFAMCTVIIMRNFWTLNTILSFGVVDKSHDLFAQWCGQSTSPLSRINSEEGGVIKGILPMICFFLFGAIWISILHTLYKEIETTIGGLEQLTPTIYRTIEK